DNAAPPDTCTVEDYRAHPDQAVILHRAAVHHRAVADRDVGTDAHRVSVIDVDHASVLDVAARAHLDAVHVAAQHTAVEDAGLLPQHHLPDQCRVRSHPRLRVYLRNMILKVDRCHRASPPFLPARRAATARPFCPCAWR